MKKVIFFFLVISTSSLHAQAVNDSHDNAIVLNSINSWVSLDKAYTNEGATADGTPGSCASSIRNVWFKFQATTSEIELKVLTGGTRGTISYPVLTLFDDSGNILSCQKTSGAPVAFIQNTSLTPGSWYYFSVDDANVPGTFSLSVTDVISYDLKVKATLLTNLNSWSSADAVYSNVNATFDGVGGTCGNPTRNVWFKFQATTSEIELKVLTGGTRGTISYPVLTLFDDSGSMLSCQKTSGAPVAFIQNTALTPGSWYYFSVDDANVPGTFSLSVTDVISYDLKAKATLLTNLNSWSSADAAYSNVNATFDGVGGTCGNPVRNVWFKFQATTSEIELKVLTGGTRGTISYPVVTLFDDSGSILSCQKTSGAPVAFIQNTTLVPGSWYYFSVDDANLPGTFTLQIADQLSSYPKPTVPASNLTFTNVNLNSLTLNWTPGNGARRVVIMRVYNNTMNRFPSDGESFSANANLAQAQSLGQGSFVVYDGVDNTVTITGLTNSTQYGFGVFEYNGMGSTSAYLVNNFLSGSTFTAGALKPTVSSSNLTFTNVSSTQMTLNWTPGNGEHRVIIMAASRSQISRFVYNGESYQANANMAQAQNLGQGNFVVYNGTGSGVTITGLTASTQYSFGIFEYNGSGETSSYLGMDETSSYLTSALTGSQSTTVPNYDFKADALLMEDISSWSSADAAYSNVGATGMGFNEESGRGYRNVWFKFQATTNEIEIKVLSGGTKGTLSGPRLTLFDVNGNTISSFQTPGHAVAYIDNITLTPGSTYYFSVDDENSGPGTFTLQVNDRVGYDMRAKAEALTTTSNWASADAFYSNAEATGAGFNETPNGGYRNVWFKFQATTNEIEIKVLSGGTKGTLSGPRLTLFDVNGNTISSLQTPGYTTAYIDNITLIPGSTYYFSVDDENSGPGTFTLQVNDHVGYDMRAKAEALTTTSNWSSADAFYSNVEATGAGFNETPNGGYRNVWFKFQATTNEIEIKVISGGTKGTLSGPRLTLFDVNGNAISSLQTPGYTTAYIDNITLIPGSTYYFSIDDENSGPGTFTLQVNDHVGYDMRAKAEVLTTISNWSSADAIYSNEGATGAAFNETHGAYHNVWFVFQAATNEISIRVLDGGSQGTLRNAVLSLFDESGALLLTNKSPTTAFIQSLALTPGSVYYFSVDDDGGGTPGSFTLQVDDEITNNFFSKAQLIPDIQSFISEDGIYSNTNGTPDFNGSPCGGPFHNVWYKFQATAESIEILVTSGGSKGTLQYPLITLFDSDSLAVNCDGGYQKALIDSTLVTPGAWYYLSVDNYQGGTGTFTMQIKNNSDYTPIGCLPSRADEYHALMALYAATNGASWTNNTGWRDANPGVVQSVQGWYGITLNEAGRIVTLNLENNNLTGKIPVNIGNLRALNKLLLNNNHLNNEIPAEIGNLSCLTELRLNNNQLTGLIPVSLENLTSLSVLNVSNNVLNGIITTVIGDLRSLRDLRMQSNNFTGQIPPSFGNLVSMTFLDLSSNQLEGEIPTSFGNLTELTALQLDSNKLSGVIPAELGNLTQLQDLRLNANQLTGSIPNELSNMRELNVLHLQNNQLSGNIPDSFSQLTKLSKLYLNNNTLTGTIGFVSGLVALTELVVNDNSFSGAIPNLSQASNLVYLTADNNDFTSVHADILSLSSLHAVTLSNNALTSLPDFSAQANKADLELNVAQNYLTFTSLLSFITNPGFRSLNYAPQKPIDQEKIVKAAVGQPLALTTAIDRNTSPASTFQWFKRINGVESALNLSSTDGHTLTIPAMAAADAGTQYYYTISNPSSALVLTSKIQTFNIAVCSQPTLDFQFERVNGKYVFTPMLGASTEVCTTSYSWTFGDGITSTESQPNHVYSSGGNYTVNLNITYSCEGCPASTLSMQHQLVIDQSFCSIIYCDGNGIGIGTTQIPSGYSLAVKGKVIMEGAKVSLQSRWPDYVFEKGYKLMDVQKLKEYIVSNNHLPGLPAAKVVKQEGIDIGEMNTILLQKIEELTLYMIQLDEQVKELEDKAIPNK